MRRPRILLATGTAIAITFGVTAPTAAASPPTDLAGAVDAQRAAAGCPPLQVHDLITNAARLASENTRDYAAHHTAAVPFTDPTPALTTIGYATSNAVLLSGYGVTMADAIQGIVLHYRASKLDCSHTHYGVNLLRDDAIGHIASVVLATPA